MDLLGHSIDVGRESDKALLAKRGKKRTFIVGADDRITHLKIVQAQIEEKLKHYKDDFLLVTEKKELDLYVKAIIKNGIFAFDTETDSPWPIKSGSYCLDATIIGFSLYTPGKKAIYVPLNHTSLLTGNLLANNLPINDAKKSLAPIFGLKGAKCICHNAKFDLRIARHTLGLEIYPFFDTQIAMHLLNENEETGLKASYDRILATPEEKGVYTFEDLFKEVKIANVLPNVACLYAARDAFLTFKLYEYARAEFDKEENHDLRTVFTKIEMPLIRVVAGMEDEGIKVDTARNKELTELYKEKLEKTDKEINKSIQRFSKELNAWRLKNNKADEPFNPNSTVQLSVIIYDILKIVNPITPASRSTDEETLQALLERDELFPMILRYREYKKVLSTYLENIDKTTNKRTGHVHCSFKQNGTVTGRFSSEGPNMQNIPKRGDGALIRTQYIPDDGCLLVSADYSQQEPRILADLSGDKFLIDTYKQGKDLYMAMGNKFSGKNYVYDAAKEKAFLNGVESKEGLSLRKKMKGVTLAIMYGEEDKALAESLKITEKEAAKFRKDFYASFPLVKKFVDDTHALAAQQGYVETCAGRRRRLPILMKPDFEISYKEGMAAEFDPLDFNAEQKNIEVPKEVQRKWITRLERAYGFKQKVAVKAAAEEEGIIVREYKNLKSKPFRQSVNTVIQGSAGDMIKLAMVLLDSHKDFKKLGGKLKLQVHDELVPQIKNDHNVAKQKQTIRDCMLEAADMLISVPMNVDVDIFKHGWDGAKL